MGLGKLHLAAAAYRAAVDADGEDTGGWNNLGVALERLDDAWGKDKTKKGTGRLPEAVAAWTRAVEPGP